jgi:predicted AAA+ superfamily ATPase
MEISDTLLLLNDWWKSGKVSEDLAKPYKRKAFAEALRLFTHYRQVVILTGLRRVGKSTIIYQLISYLLSKGVDPKNVLYFTFDLNTIELHKLLEEYGSLTGVDWKNSKVYLFFDELQKLENWSSQLKVLYDRFPNLKIVISGSASLQLEGKAVSDLAGRYFTIDITPLSIIEYYELKNSKQIDRPELYEDDLRQELRSYIEKPFPEIVKWTSEMDIRTYIRENVIAKIVRGDLPSTFHSVNFRLLESMLSLFYSEPGMILSTDALAKELGISKTTLENHIFYLEFAKLIRVVRNYRPNLRMESRKLKKVYPYDISLALAYNNVQEPYAMETLVASALNLSLYWRMQGKEVDFVNKEPLVPIEVKSGEKIGEGELTAIKYFVRKYRAKKGIVAYNGTAYITKEAIEIVPILRLLVEGNSVLK